MYNFGSVTIATYDGTLIIITSTYVHLSIHNTLTHTHCQMYVGGNLVHADYVFNGYGTTKRDFMKQVRVTFIMSWSRLLTPLHSLRFSAAQKKLPKATISPPTTS